MSDFEPAAAFLGAAAVTALLAFGANKLGFTYFYGLVYRDRSPKLFGVAMTLWICSSLVFFLLGLGTLIGTLRS